MADSQYYGGAWRTAAKQRVSSPVMVVVARGRRRVNEGPEAITLHGSPESVNSPDDSRLKELLLEHGVFNSVGI
jgi:GMP synthase-like glutamine amidotransferase